MTDEKVSLIAVLNGLWKEQTKREIVIFFFSNVSLITLFHETNLKYLFIRSYHNKVSRQTFFQDQYWSFYCGFTLVSEMLLEGI